MLSQKVNVGLKRAGVLRKKTDELCLPKQQQEDERRSTEREHKKHAATLSAPEQPFGNFFGGNPFLAASAQQAPSSPAAPKKMEDAQVLGLLALLVPFLAGSAQQASRSAAASKAGGEEARSYLYLTRLWLCFECVA